MTGVFVTNKNSDTCKYFDALAHRPHFYLKKTLLIAWLREFNSQMGFNSLHLPFQDNSTINSFD